MKKFLMCVIVCLEFSAIFSEVENPWGYDSRYYQISQKINSDTGILVIAYNRPDYFQQVIEALEKTPEAQTLPFFFILDGGENATQKENIDIILNSCIKNKEIIARKVNYGCGRNIIDSRRFMFEWCNFERIVLIEDDLVINPEYITLTLNLHDWAKNNFENVGVVQCFNNCFKSLEEKEQQLDVVEEVYGNFWGYCLDKNTYNNIKDMLNEYEENFLINIPPNQPNGFGIADWMQFHLDSYPEKVWEKKFKSVLNYKSIFSARINSMKARMAVRRDGQDIEMRLAMFKAGYIKITTRVNRAKYIGKRGVHHNSDHWLLQGFDNVELNQFFDDAYRKKFIPVYDQLNRLKILIVIPYLPKKNSLMIKHQFKALVEEGHEITFLIQEDVMENLRNVINYHVLGNCTTDMSAFQGRMFDIVYYPFGNYSQEWINLVKNYNDKCKVVINFPELKIGKDCLIDIVEKSDLVVTSSNVLKDVLGLLECDLSKIFVVYSSLDCSKLYFRERNLKPGEVLKVLSIMTNATSHVIREFLCIVPVLKTYYPNVELQIIVDKSDNKLFTDLAVLLKGEEKIKITNYSNKKDLIARLYESHLFIHPSMNNNSSITVNSSFVKQESIPEILKIVIATGLPVIASNQNGIDELIDDGVSGYLVSENNIEALAHKLHLLIQKRHEWSEMGRAGRKKILTELDTKQCDKYLVSLFENIIS